MVGGKEAWKITRQFKTRAVRKRVGRPRRDQSLPLQQIEVGVERDPAQSKNCSRANQSEFQFEIRKAVSDFPGQWFVVGRGTANRRRNHRVFEDQSVVGAL